MEPNYYVVVVQEGEIEKYLFNRRSLVGDIALARHFSDLIPAKRYFIKSIFSTEHYRIEPVIQEEPPIDPHNPGTIVE